ncbi:MAG: hypothetical protein IJ292_05375 [Clostridia bacterium]|nr:hypothetical protein [Clostridia bacterium]
MKKKILSICLVAIIAITAIAGASLAYLTDRDSAENVFTFGNVEIKLNETFEDNELIPGKKLAKEATIANTGKNDAWVWITVAIPTVLDGGADASKNVLHMNIPGKYWDDYFDDPKYSDGTVTIDQTWNADYNSFNTMIDNVEYTVYTHLYNGKLAAGATTTTCLSTVYLDAHVDINTDGQLYWVEDGTATKIDWNVNDNGAPSVYVSAYAIQKEGFENVEDAYKAYNEQWGNNGAEYGAVVKPATQPAA